MPLIKCMNVIPCTVALWACETMVNWPENHWNHNLPLLITQWPVAMRSRDYMHMSPHWQACCWQESYAQSSELLPVNFFIREGFSGCFLWCSSRAFLIIGCEINRTCDSCRWRFWVRAIGITNLICKIKVNKLMRDTYQMLNQYHEKQWAYHFPFNWVLLWGYDMVTRLPSWTYPSAYLCLFLGSLWSFAYSYK